MPVNKTTATERMIEMDRYVDKLEALVKDLLQHVPTGNGARLAEDYDEHPMRSRVKETLKERPR